MAAALLLAGAAPALHAQQPQRPDTTRRDSAQVLPTLTVTRQPEAPNRAPVATAVLGRDAVQRAQLTIGVDEALNNVPGVYVQNRYNFAQDQRISIRGAGSRANFGTRGLKVLLDGVPQTLPDGQTQFSSIDLGLVRGVEVLRGASSSLYGNASGGVISFTTDRPAAEPFSARARVEGGSFGLVKWQGVLTTRSGPVSTLLSVSRFTWDGFRQQSAADFRRLNFGLDYALSGSTELSVRLNLTNDPVANNPGALSPAEYAANRDSAPAVNILRQANEDLEQQQASALLRSTDRDGNVTEATVFGLVRGLDNALATPPPGAFVPNVGTFVRLDRRSGGLRFQRSQRLGADPRLPRLTAGADLQSMRDLRTNFRAVAGVPTDSILLDQKEAVFEVGPFVQLGWTPAERVFVSAGGRFDYVKFSVTDYNLRDGVDNSGTRENTALNGNIGLSVEASRAFTPYANVSTAFETPTTTELVNQAGGQGGFNDQLQPQRATQFEIGLRGALGATADYSVAAFRVDVRDAIVQFREVSGRAYFVNAGETRNQGVEATLSVSPVRPLRIFGSYTYADYTFTDYKVTSGATVDTLDGNRLAGVPKHFARVGVRLAPGLGLALDVDHTISSSMFADDRNTEALVVPDWGYGVTNVRASWRAVTRGLEFTPFVAVYNLQDRDYISGVTVNGTQSRVWEPAPLRNFYAGAELAWRSPLR